VDFTAQLEERLDEVEDGRYPWLHLLQEFYGPFEEKLLEAEKRMEKIQVADEESEEECPKCQRKLVYKLGRFGKFLACPGFPECRFTKPIVKEAGVDCPTCGKPVLLRKTKRGRLFYGCSDYPDCQFTSWEKPVAEKCPECQSYLVEKNARNKSYLACANKECKFKK
jgi:DNA topoisomerase I